jgi:enamine deaminase RidA (YjgF/YER057c/UK114 family)
LNRDYLSPKTMPEAPGYTHVVKAGGTVYIAGQVSADTENDLVHAGDLEQQARQIWHNLEAAVKSVGGTLQDIVKTTTYVTDINNFAVLRQVRNEYWEGLTLPANTMLVVKQLGDTEYMACIEAIAIVD